MASTACGGTLYPAGLPCELGIQTSIPAPDPLALALVALPEHNATYGTKGFEVAPGIATPNANVVAGFGFQLNINTTGTCATTVGQPYPAALRDTALGNNSNAGDPTHFGGPDGTDDAVAYPGEMFDTSSWPTHIDTDATVQALQAGGALLWARYTANTVIQTPVNILVYNEGTQYVYYTLTGDPTAAPTPPGGRCTPFITRTDYLGKDRSRASPCSSVTTPTPRTAARSWSPPPIGCFCSAAF